MIGQYSHRDHTSKKRLIVIASSSISKNLPYQSISIITREIVLVILQIITLIEDQVGCLLIFISYISFIKSVVKHNYLFWLNIIVIAFITETIENNPQV